MEVLKRGCCTLLDNFVVLIVSRDLKLCILQVTPKTLADVKGGTLISYEGKVQVLFSSKFHPPTPSPPIYDQYLLLVWRA